jgi:protein SCO1/2
MIRTVIPALFAAAWLAGPAAAHDGHRHQAAVEPSAAMQTISLDLPDTKLIDTDGRPQRLASDVVAGRLVVMDFIFTSCTAVCPILSSIMAEVQDRLENRIGRDVTLLSVSVDPARDTPARLRDYADHFGARPGWVFLTGAKPDIDGLQTRLGTYSGDYTEHAPAVLIGDPAAGNWVRLFGMPSPDQILVALDQLSLHRRHSHAAP